MKKIILIIILFFIPGLSLNAIENLAGYKTVCEEDNLIKKLESSKDKIYASSELPSKNSRYAAKNIFDGKKDTCWCPVGDGIGEYFIFEVPKDIKGLKIINGLSASDKLYYENNRVKELFIGLFVKNEESKKIPAYDVCNHKEYKSLWITGKKNKAVLKESTEFQMFIFEKMKKNFYIYKSDSIKPSKKLYMIIGIDSIYKGSKYNDTCISEIEIIK